MRCIIGEISISNAFSITHILFDPTTEHVYHFQNRYIYSTRDNFISRMIRHYQKQFIFVYYVVDNRLPSNHKMITQCDFNHILFGNSFDIRSECFLKNPRKTLSGILESTKKVFVYSQFIKYLYITISSECYII